MYCRYCVYSIIFLDGPFFLISTVVTLIFTVHITRPITSQPHHHHHRTPTTTTTLTHRSSHLNPQSIICSSKRGVWKEDEVQSPLDDDDELGTPPTIFYASCSPYDPVSLPDVFDLQLPLSYHRCPIGGSDLFFRRPSS